MPGVGYLALSTFPPPPYPNALDNATNPHGNAPNYPSSMVMLQMLMEMHPMLMVILQCFTFFLHTIKLSHQNILKEKLPLIKRTLLNDLRCLPTNANIF